MLLLLFRGERASQTPEIVFKEGFKPRGSSTDLLYHTSLNKALTIYVSATPLREIAVDFAGKNGYLYVIQTDRAIDVYETLKERLRFPEQVEFAIPNGVLPGEIVGVYHKRGGQLSTDFIRNPDFKGEYHDD